jgi:Ca2+-binding EF-hand superfamily protein
MHVLTAAFAGTLLALSPAVMAQDAPPASSGPTVEQIFQFLDADQDGFLQKSEAQGPLAEHFDVIDADKDSKVSPDEVRAAMAMRDKMRAEGGQPAEPK